MAKIIPELIVSNIEASLTFYNGLGFEKDNTGIVDERGSQWYSLALGDANVWLLREDTVEGFDEAAARGHGVHLYVTVDDVDAVYEKMKSNPRGGIIALDIATQWYGLREFKIADPDGYVWTVNTPVSEQAVDATDGQD
jgi:uncharacterized glyoxalase superfamily protein PhnB